MHLRETMIFHFGITSAILWTFVIEICSQAVSKAPGCPLFCNYLFKPLQGRTWPVSPGWRAQRRGLTWRMCPCPPACWNVINAPHIEPAEQITFAQHVSNVSMGDGWSVPIWMKTFLNWAFLLNPGNWPAGEGKLNACRWKGSEAWILPSHRIQSFCNIFFYPFFLFLLSRPFQYSNSLLYSYFCLLIAFKILFVFSYFCLFIAFKIPFLSHICFLNLNIITFIIL